MFFTSPGATPYDLRFRLFGFPISINPIFWIVALILSPSKSPKEAIVWCFAVLVSILVHELGHALVMRSYGGQPRIVLYGFGGLAITERMPTSWFQNVITSLAGPFFGIFFYVVVYVVARQFGMPDNDMFRWFVACLLLINLYWNLFNLVPIYPLDGGQVARELLTRFVSASAGIIMSLWLSIVCCVVVGVYVVMQTGSTYNLLLFALLGYQNYQTLVAYNRSSRGW